MIRRAKIYSNGTLAGILEMTDRHHYTFRYDNDYFINPKMNPISLSLKKANREFSSPVLFPFFSGLLAEGINRETQARLLRIDENDLFSLLLATAQTDTIGSITVKEILP